MVRWGEQQSSKEMVTEGYNIGFFKNIVMGKSTCIRVFISFII